jgi:hypothetical protein
MTLSERLKSEGYAMDALFIPWSKSRNAKPNPKLSDRNLNWHVTITFQDRIAASTEYSAGLAYCPSYNAREHRKPSVDYVESIVHECETGLTWQGSYYLKSKRIEPDLALVLNHILSDGEAIDYASFEDWAVSYGYDPDSRKAEKLYRLCLDIGLQLRAALGDAELNRLRDLFAEESI